MRITFALTYDRMNQSINRKKEELDRLTTMGSTGKRLIEPQDDPLAWSQAMDIKQGLREFETFQKNMEFSVGWNQTTEDALDQLSDVLTSAHGIAIQAMGVNSAEKQAGQVESLEQMAKDAVSLANTQYGSQYIFSGRLTSTAPFDPSDLSYEGDTGSIEVRVGKDRHQTVNLDGQTVFFTDPADPDSNILKTFDALKTAIQAGDTDAIQQQMSTIEAAQQQLSARQAIVGSRLSSLDGQQSALSSLKLDQQARLEDVEDADMAE